VGHSAISASKLTNGVDEVHDILSHKNQLQNKTIFNRGLINRLARSLVNAASKLTKKIFHRSLINRHAWSLVNAASKLTNHRTRTFSLQPDKAPCHQVSVYAASKTANWEEGHNACLTTSQRQTISGHQISRNLTNLH
jgi:hypothetical protein